MKKVVIQKRANGTIAKVIDKSYLGDTKWIYWSRPFKETSEYVCYYIVESNADTTEKYAVVLNNGGMDLYCSSFEYDPSTILIMCEDYANHIFESKLEGTKTIWINKDDDLLYLVPDTLEYNGGYIPTIDDINEILSRYRPALAFRSIQDFLDSFEEYYAGLEVVLNPDWESICLQWLADYYKEIRKKAPRSC